MSRCAHSKSTFELIKLPKCSRCNKEFVLILSSYKQGDKPVEEWECQKCHKVVKRGLLKEEQLTKDEKFFVKKSEELEKYGRINCK